MMRKRVVISGKWRYVELRKCPQCKEEKWIRVDALCCSASCAKLRETKKLHNLSHNDYVKIHRWLQEIKGKATSCVNGCINVARYEWANQTGDYWNLDDYIQMCSSCHREFDRKKMHE